MTGSYQVWTSRQQPRLPILCGPQPGSQPPAPITYRAAPPLPELLIGHGRIPIALIAHYDVHGLAMLALTLRSLQQAGVREVDCQLSFEWTGDISKLWKRTVPRALASPREYAAIMLIDCSVHSRQPERTLKALASLEERPGTRLVMIDHHADTFDLCPELTQAGAQVVLTDILSCSLLGKPDGIARELMLLGALADKSPEVALKFTAARYPQLHSTVQAYQRWMLHFSPTPKDLAAQDQQPLRPLWEALAAGEPPTVELAERLLGQLPPPEALDEPQHACCGSVAVVTERLAIPGRSWYGVLEALMERTGLAYAVAMRVLDRRRANLLLLTDWHAIQQPPMRCFIPPEYLSQCLGHPGATWLDLPAEQALPALTAVLSGLNEFHQTPGDIAAVIGALKHNLLDTPSPPVQKPFS